MINQVATDYLKRLSKLLLSLEVTDGNSRVLSLDKAAGKTVKMILAIKSTSKKVMLIGNGGSAAIASHAQNDLCKTVGVQAIVFNETPLLTALSNDYGYESVFERSLNLWANRGDLLFALSSSGQSENILRAVRVAIRRKCRVITLSGFSRKNPLRRMGHLNFYVPGQIYGYVEVSHSLLLHFFTDCAMVVSK